MGKSQKPLTILVHTPDIWEWKEMQDLAAQGHVVATPYDLRLGNVTWEELDLILDPRAWRMDEQHRKYLALAIAQARKLRYPGKKS